jgi:hypothetical protein
MQISANERSIPYYPGIGYMYRIPRNDNKGKHVSSETRKDWLKELRSTQTRFSVNSICGELSSIEFIKDIFGNPDYERLCDSYEVVFGPELDTKEIRAELKPYMENSKLKVYSYPNRPESHGIKVNDRLLCEEMHKKGTRYQFATIIEKAERSTQDNFMSYFDLIKLGSERKTIENIDLVPSIR